MADQPQAQPPAAAAAEPVDDGFTDAERVEFETMREGTPDPVDAPPAEAAPETPPAAVAPPAGAEGADDDDEGDDDDAAAAGEGAAAGAAPADGAAPAHRVKTRVSGRKYEREKAARETAEAKLADAEKTQARLDERLKIIGEAIAPKPAAAKTAAEEDPEPDKEADLFGWLDWKKRDDGRRDARFSELETRLNSETEEREISTEYVRDARAFATTEPQFGPAYNYLMGLRTAQLAAFFYEKDLTADGVTLTPAEQKRINAEMASEERDIVAQAIKSGKSPAARIFQMAKATGFRPAAAAQPAEGEGEAGAAPAATNGAGKPGKPPFPGTNGAAAPSVKDEIANIRAGSEAARSLSQGGGAPTTPLTAQKLATMSDAQFGEFMETADPDQLRALLGD